MTMRKTQKIAQDTKDRINEMHNRKIFLQELEKERKDLEARLTAGDQTAVKRAKEVMEMVDEHNAWIATNAKIIKTRLRAS